MSPRRPISSSTSARTWLAVCHPRLAHRTPRRPLPAVRHPSQGHACQLRGSSPSSGKEAVPALFLPEATPVPLPIRCPAPGVTVLLHCSLPGKKVMAPSSSVFPARVCPSEHQPSLLFSIYDSPPPSCPQSGLFLGWGWDASERSVFSY